MYSLVIMVQKYEGVLKINVRPNLDVILQIGVIDSNQESMEFFKFYLETLELMLKDFNVWADLSMDLWWVLSNIVYYVYTEIIIIIIYNVVQQARIELFTPSHMLKNPI